MRSREETAQEQEGANRPRPRVRLTPVSLACVLRFLKATPFAHASSDHTHTHIHMY